MRKHTDTCRHGSYVSVGRLKVNMMDKWTREYASDKFHRTIKEERRGKRQERGDIGGPCFKTQGTWGCSMRFVLHKAFVKWANIPAVWSEVSRVGQAGKGVQNIIFACFLRSKISFLVWWKVDWPYLSMGSGRNSWEEGRPGTGRGEEWRKQVTAVQTECSTSMELRGRPEPQTVSPRLLSLPPVIALLCQMALLLGEFILDLLRAK